MCRSGAQGAFTMQSSDMESVAKEWQNKNVHFLTSERCVKSTEHLPKVKGLGLFQKCPFQWYRVASMPDQCLRQSRYHPDFNGRPRLVRDGVAWAVGYLGASGPCLGGCPLRPYSAKMLVQFSGKTMANFKVACLNKWKLCQINRRLAENQ